MDIFDTWECHICGKERLDKDISVRMIDISKDYNLQPGTMQLNVRYCNDNPDCAEKSKTYRKSKINANIIKREKT